MNQLLLEEKNRCHNNLSDYFKRSQYCSDDKYIQNRMRFNYYRYGFIVTSGLCLLLIIIISFLIPTQHLQPILIHHYHDGSFVVEPIKRKSLTINQSQMQSELVHYVIERERFDANTYDTQYALINLMSDNLVAKEYINEQSIHNKYSPINVLGHNGTRRVHIDSVISLDPENKNKNQQINHTAQVNFSVTSNIDHQIKCKSYVAIIHWYYRGIPNDPKDLWRNWDGFTVTRYDVTQRNI